jgi:hypothetical protein
MTFGLPFWLGFMSGVVFMFVVLMAIGFAQMGGAVTFDGVEQSKNFLRAVKTAAALDTTGFTDAALRKIAMVTFRPYPSKSPGFWRIEVTYAKTNLGSYRIPYTGAEWYVHEDQLWAAWEAAARE